MPSGHIVFLDQVYPGESLLSLLYRLSDLNFYEPRGVLPIYVQDELSHLGVQDNLNFPQHQMTIDTLVELTSLNQNAIIGATVHSFANIFQFPSHSRQPILHLAKSNDLPLKFADVQSHTYGALANQFCPLCLREGPYHQLRWSLFAISSCLQHSCLLAKNCPHCKHSVSIRDITYGNCSKCSAALAEHDTRNIPIDSFDFYAQQLIQSWFGLVTSPNDLQFRPFPKATAAGLYHFAFWLHQFEYAKKQNHRRSYIAKTQIPETLTLNAFSTAIKVLCQWPRNFEEFLSEYRRSTSKERAPSIDGQLGRFYIWLQRNSSHNEFDFVQHAFDDYLVSEFDQNYNLRLISRFQKSPELASRLRFITTTEASKILNVAPRSLGLLARAGQLKRHLAVDRPFALYAREEVMQLDAKWRAELSLKEAANAIGASEDVTRALITIGVLHGERDASPPDHAKWSISELQVKTLLLRLSTHIRFLQPSERERLLIDTGCRFIDLVEATKMMVPVGANAAIVLLAVIEGRLAAFTDRIPVRVKDIVFADTLVQQCVTSIQISKNWISRGDAEKLLGVKSETFDRWVQNGRFAPIAKVATCSYFNREEIIRFHNEHVYSDDAAGILGVGVLTVQKWVRNGRLHAVSGPQIDGNHSYLIRRDEVNQIKSYLTATAMAEALGVTRTTLGARIQKGELRPVSGPGIDLSGHYLFEPQVTNSALPLQEDNPQDKYE